MFAPPVVSRTNVAKINEELASKLGNGVTRFGPILREHDLQGQIEQAECTQEQVHIFAAIKASWDVDTVKVPKDERLTNEQVFRVARFCDFNEKRSMRLLSHTHRRYFELTSHDLEKQLLTKTLFPCPGLTTKEGWDTFYMRPSRHFVKETSTRDIIDNLLYVMDHIQKRNPTGEIAFLANMDDWTMDNFSNAYCLRFMAALQGRFFPVKVSLFMIVNPPSWFEKIWKYMKTVLSADFVQRVILISDEELPYLMDMDFEKYLPDEITGGEVVTEELVKDFVAFCKVQDSVVSSSWSRKKSAPSKKERRTFWKWCRRGGSYKKGTAREMGKLSETCSTATSKAGEVYRQ